MDFSNLDKDELIAFRRERHQYPENGWTEFLTTSAIIKKLEEFNVPYLFGKAIHTKGERYGVPSDEILDSAMKRALKEGADPNLLKNMEGGYTGVVAVIDTKREGPTTGIRCDIDCNDVEESKDIGHFPFKEGFSSKHEKLMHACGHDVHTTIGIGTAKILMDNLDKLCGKIKIFFQPAEEGTRGGASMADGGLLDDVDLFFGGHMWTVGQPLGEITASTINESVSYKVDLEFKGTAAHAGMFPEKGCNALASASCAVLNLLAISRHSEGRTRINVGTCEAGTGRNVIPDHALLKTEVRGINEEVNEYMLKRMLTVARSAALMYDCEFSYKIQGHSVSAVCDEEMMEKVRQAAHKTEGITKVHDFMDMHGGGDDITFLMKKVQERGGKATFIWLGADTTAPLHDSSFSLNEEIIPLGVKLYSNLIYDINKLK